MQDKINPIQITAVQFSPNKSKKYRVFLSNGRHYDFGSKTSQTYLDHNDEKKRFAYIARHYANPTEKELIDTLTPSPSLFSMTLLWGYYPDLERNIDYLNKQFKDNQIIR